MGVVTSEVGYTLPQAEGVTMWWHWGIKKKFNPSQNRERNTQFYLDKQEV
jgi:hypothetical protein